MSSFMQNVVYSIFDVQLLILYRLYTTIMRQYSIMQVVLNKKSTTEITLFSVRWYLNMSVFLSQF